MENYPLKTEQTAWDLTASNPKNNDIFVKLKNSEFMPDM